jgi:hypothetical protein
MQKSRGLRFSDLLSSTVADLAMESDIRMETPA